MDAEIWVDPTDDGYDARLIFLRSAECGELVGKGSTIPEALRNLAAVIEGTPEVVDARIENDSLGEDQ